MAKIQKQQDLIPSTPEELASLVQQASPAAPAPSPLHKTVGQLPKKGETPVPASLKGPQGELLTGMPPKAPAGPETPVPIELKGAQGELLTEQAAAPAPAAKAAAPSAASAAPVASLTPETPAEPAETPAETPALAEPALEAAAEKPGAPDWLQKLGAIAKNTGRGILELVSAFGQGYSGMEGPTVTERRLEREQQEKLQANERDFAKQLQQLQQEWQAAQGTARNEQELEQQRQRIEAQAAQAEADRQSNEQQAALDRASSERIAGMRTAPEGAVPGEDPAITYLRKLFGGGK